MSHRPELDVAGRGRCHGARKVVAAGTVQLKACATPSASVMGNDCNF